MRSETTERWEARSRSVSDNSLVVTTGAPDYEEVCQVRAKADRTYGKQDERDKERARLIAAAPEMAEALRLCWNAFGGPCEADAGEAHEALTKARAALDKARGATP